MNIILKGFDIMEIWKDVVGYEGVYEVSDLGNIRRKSTGRILSQRVDMYGYKRVTLSKQGKMKTHQMHRLVAIAFIENPSNLPQVNHQDKNRINNKAYNLEWCTQQYNLEHGRETGGSKYKHLSESEVKEIRRLHKEEKIFFNELSEMFGVSYTTIYNVLERKGRYAKI